MAKLEIREEGEGMNGADSTVDLEEKIGNGLPWEHISNYELCYDVISRLLQPQNIEERCC